MAVLGAESLRMSTMTLAWNSYTFTRSHDSALPIPRLFFLTKSTQDGLVSSFAERKYREQLPLSFAIDLSQPVQLGLQL